MSELSAHLEDYLRLRRALGFKLERPGQDLAQFLDYLDGHGATRITTALAIAWAGLPEDRLPVYRAHRLAAIRGFARYMVAIDPATEVPPSGVWSATTPRRTPFALSGDDLVRILAQARTLTPAFRGRTCEALFGLLASSGMRVGEALSLERDDVDLTEGVLSVRRAKFDRSRSVPLHASVTEALAAYAAARFSHLRRPSSSRFFVGDAGRALRYGSVQVAFVEITSVLGLRRGSVRPRIHDLRH